MRRLPTNSHGLPLRSHYASVWPTNGASSHRRIAQGGVKGHTYQQVEPTAEPINRITVEDQDKLFSKAARRRPYPLSSPSSPAPTISPLLTRASKCLPITNEIPSRIKLRSFWKQSIEASDERGAGGVRFGSRSSQREPNWLQVPIPNSTKQTPTHANNHPRMPAITHDSATAQYVGAARTHDKSAGLAGHKNKSRALFTLYAEDVNMKQSSGCRSRSPPRDRERHSENTQEGKNNNNKKKHNTHTHKHTTTRVSIDRWAGDRQDEYNKRNETKRTEPDQETRHAPVSRQPSPIPAAAQRHERAHPFRTPRAENVNPPLGLEFNGI